MHFARMASSMVPKAVVAWIGLGAGVGLASPASPWVPAGPSTVCAAAASVATSGAHDTPARTHPDGAAARIPADERTPSDADSAAAEGADDRERRSLVEGIVTSLLLLESAGTRWQAR
jgi:hypothetical protein